MRVTICILVLSGALAACGNSNSSETATPDEESAATDLPPPDQTYTLRGVIRDISPGEMRIQHEAIDTFANEQGEVVGMDAMTMPFIVAPELALEDLVEHQKVEFTFEVRWSEGPRLLVTQIQALPPSTEIEFGPAGAGDRHEGHDHGPAEAAEPAEEESVSGSAAETAAPSRPANQARAEDPQDAPEETSEAAGGHGDHANHADHAEAPAPAPTNHEGHEGHSH